MLVVRGLIPEAVADTDPPIDGVEPPSGPVRVVGYLMPTQTKGFFGSTDASTGTLHELSAGRRGAVRQAVRTQRSRPFWIQLERAGRRRRRPARRDC